MTASKKDSFKLLPRGKIRTRVNGREAGEGLAGVFRFFEGDALSIEVEWTGPDEFPIGARFFLFTNLVGGEWREMSFDEKGLMEITVKTTGRFFAEPRLRVGPGQAVHVESERLIHFAVDPAWLSPFRLYTLIPSAFGKISAWISELPKIKAMGFDAVHILPVTEMDLSGSPYAAFDLFQIDPLYLSKEGGGWEEWIAVLKKNELRLCVDLVLNHVGVTSRLATEKPHWIKHDPDREDGLRRAGYLGGDTWHFWEDLVLVNYEHKNPGVREEIWDAMMDYAVYWAGFAAATGGMIRFDNLHSSHEPFVRRLLSRLRREFPGLAFFGEFFAPREEVDKLSWEYGLALNLATPWVNPYAYQLRAHLVALHEERHLRYLFPISSHDSGTPTQEYGGVLATLSRYAVGALLSTGQTGITSGVEYAQPEKIPFIGRPKPIAFKEHAELREGIRKINDLLKKNPVFWECGNLRFVDENHGAILAGLRGDFLVIANLDAKGAHDLKINTALLAKEGRAPLKAFCEYSEKEFVFDKAIFSLEMKAGEFYVMRLMRA